MSNLQVIDVGRDRWLAVYFQGARARRLSPAGEDAAVDMKRLRRAVRPIQKRPTLLIVHVNQRCRCVTGSWYGRSRTFRYFNHYYRNFDGDVITIVVNPRWFDHRQVVHGPYYLHASRRYHAYPQQHPMDAVVYVLAHEFAHQYLYARRHPMRFSELATDLFAFQHLARVEPRHPVAAHVRLTNRELGLLLRVLRRMPPDQAARSDGPSRRVAAGRRRNWAARR